MTIAASHHAAGSPAAVPNVPRVLIAEDPKKTRADLIAHLRRLGIEPMVATGGAEAIRMAAENRPDLLLLDGLLPQMHGFEVARFVRSIDRSYRPRIAILTAIYKGTRYENEARIRYGVDDYLAKPIAPAALARLVGMKAP